MQFFPTWFRVSSSSASSGFLLDFFKSASQYLKEFTGFQTLKWGQRKKIENVFQRKGCEMGEGFQTSWWAMFLGVFWVCKIIKNRGYIPNFLYRKWNRNRLCIIWFHASSLGITYKVSINILSTYLARSSGLLVVLPAVLVTLLLLINRPEHNLESSGTFEQCSGLGSKT